MKKLLIICIVLVISTTSLLLLARYNNDLLDRANPFVKKHWSYAEVPYYKETKPLTVKKAIEIQDYKNIKAYDKEGNVRSYKLSFKGHNPYGQYVKIEHKGKWIFFIEYISKKEFESKVKQ